MTPDPGEVAKEAEEIIEETWDKILSQMDFTDEIYRNFGNSERKVEALQESLYDYLEKQFARFASTEREARLAAEKLAQDHGYENTSLRNGYDDLKAEIDRLKTELHKYTHGEAAPLIMVQQREENDRLKKLVTDLNAGRDFLEQANNNYGKEFDRLKRELEFSQEILADREYELKIVREERDHLQQILKQDCETEEIAKTEAKKVLTEKEVEGDSFGVPTVADVMELLVKRLEASKEEVKRLAEIRDGYEKQLDANSKYAKHLEAEAGGYREALEKIASHNLGDEPLYIAFNCRKIARAALTPAKATDIDEDDYCDEDFPKPNINVDPSLSKGIYSPPTPAKEAEKEKENQ